MEKNLKSTNDKEYMRVAMLKHEETFREQVNELHRLYRIQKMLMESVGQQQQQQQPQKLERCNNNIVESSKRPFTIDHYQQQLLLQQQAQRDRISSTNNINVIKSSINNNNIMMGFNLMRPDNQILASGSPRLSSNSQEHIGESNNNGKMMMLDESEIELTLSLGPSTLNPRRKKSGESGDQSISSTSTGSSQTKKRSPKNTNSTTTWASFTHQTGSGIETGFSNGQQSNNPPLFHQALSLKLT